MCVCVCVCACLCVCVVYSIVEGNPCVGLSLPGCISDSPLITYWIAKTPTNPPKHLCPPPPPPPNSGPMQRAAACCAGDNNVKISQGRYPGQAILTCHPISSQEQTYADLVVFFVMSVRRTVLCFPSVAGPA